MSEIEPAWKRYIPAVSALRPGCGDDEMRLRCGVMHMRDHASLKRRADLPWEADQCLATVEQLGMAYAVASMSHDALMVVRESMSRLFSIAGRLAVHGPCAPEQEG